MVCIVEKLRQSVPIKRKPMMSAKFTVGQRVRIVRVDDIPYGLKYSYIRPTKYLASSFV